MLYWNVSSTPVRKDAKAMRHTCAYSDPHRGYGEPGGFFFYVNVFILTPHESPHHQEPKESLRQSLQRAFIYSGGSNETTFESPLRLQQSMYHLRTQTGSAVLALLGKQIQEHSSCYPEIFLWLNNQGISSL